MPAACAKLPYRFHVCRRLSGVPTLSLSQRSRHSFSGPNDGSWLNFSPKPKAPMFEFRKFFFYFPAQAIFFAFSRELAPSGKHPGASSRPDGRDRQFYRCMALSDRQTVLESRWMHGASSVVGTFETCRRILSMSVYRGGPEVANRLPKWRF
jgi:hypothetical protein